MTTSENKSLRVTLPGKTYRRGNRWWWHVKLPGEDKAKSRPLKAPGDRSAAADRKTAEMIAFALWEQAVREQAERRIGTESSQKIAALKAQFLDKVRHFQEIVESTTAKAEAEARARAEAEAKLRKMTESVGQRTENREPGAEIPDCGLRTSDRGLKETHAVNHQSSIINHQFEETGWCECCGAGGIPAAKLTHIDSGQLLCLRCLAALHADVARIRSHAFAPCSA
jgi:hypothetical protein